MENGKNAISCNVKEKILNPPFYLSYWGSVTTPTLQVLWKSVQSFLYNTTDKPVNQPTHGHRCKHDLLGGGKHFDNIYFHHD